jgi:hypothetical protein
MAAFRRLFLCSTLLLWTIWALDLVPSPPTSSGGAYSCRLVSLRSSDGVRLQGIVFRAAKPRAIALLLVHGFAGNFYEAYFPDSLRPRPTPATTHSH